MFSERWFGVRVLALIAVVVILVGVVFDAKAQDYDALRSALDGTTPIVDDMCYVAKDGTPLTVKNGAKVKASMTRCILGVRLNEKGEVAEQNTLYVMIMAGGKPVSAWKLDMKAERFTKLWPKGKVM